MDPRSLRTNNPGAMNFGPFAQRWGAIGTDGRLAVFPDLDTGYKAMSGLLDTYRDQHGLNTVSGIINRWAPRNVDNNSTDAYIATVARKLGVDPNQPLNAEHRDPLMQAMATYEAGRLVPGPTRTQPSPEQGPMNFFDPELLRQALQMQAAPPQPMPAEAQTSPHIMQSALAAMQQPQQMDAPTMAPAQPVMQPVTPQAPQQQGGFLDRLAAALNQPLTQQGLGLFLAASQGKDLNAGLTAGMQRSTDALKQQELRRQAQLRDAQEAFFNGLMQQRPAWANNLPPGLMEIMPALSPEARASMFGNYFLNQESNALNRDLTRAKIRQIDAEKYKTGNPDQFIYNAETGQILREGRGDKKFQDTADEEAAKRLMGHIKENDTSAPLAFDMARLDQLNKNIGNPGKWAEWKATLGPWAKTIGVDVEGVDDLQSFQNIVTKLAPRMRPTGSGATSDYEMRQYLASLPQLSQSPEARGRVIAAMQDGLNFNKERAAIAADVLNGKLSRSAAEKKIEDLTKAYEDKSASRLKAGGFRTDTQTQQQTAQLPLSPDDQMAQNVARNTQFPSHAAALAANRSAQPGVTKQVVMNGQIVTLRKRQEGGWEVVPATEAQPQAPQIGTREWFDQNMAPAMTRLR